MNIRTVASLAIAVFLGLVAVVMVRGYLSRSQPALTGQPIAGGVPIVVAATAVPRGATLQPGMLKVVNYPAASVPAGAFSTVDQLAGAGPTARAALRAMAVNEPVLAPKVTEPGGKPNLSGALAPGKRAISVRSSDVNGVAGFVLPGDRVDILITHAGGNGATVTQVLADNVRVLGVDQTDDVDTDKPQVAKAVTVEVTPQEAQIISLAQSVGTVTLSLRQAEDIAPLVRRTAVVTDIGGSDLGMTATATPRARSVRKAPPARPAPDSGLTQVRVTRGIEISAYPVSSN